jgi:hypothetical protein
MREGFEEQNNPSLPLNHTATHGQTDNGRAGTQNKAGRLLCFSLPSFLSLSFSFPFPFALPACCAAQRFSSASFLPLPVISFLFGLFMLLITQGLIFGSLRRRLPLITHTPRGNGADDG